jgi:plastocyanin
MAGQGWSITIVAGTPYASFVPDVYGSPPALQAQVGDNVSWNNQTDQEHQIYQTGGGKITEVIAGHASSTPAYTVALPGGATTGTIDYYCNFHPEEKGTINVV